MTNNDEEKKRYYSTMWGLMLGKVASEITRNTTDPFALISKQTNNRVRSRVQERR